MDRWFKAREVAEKLNLSRTTLHRLIRSGEIPGKKIGFHWRISERALQEYLEKQ